MKGWLASLAGLAIGATGYSLGASLDRARFQHRKATRLVNDTLPLNTTVRHPRVAAVERALRRAVIGQPRAVRAAADAIESALVLQHEDRPAGVYLMLGPTGSGKTRLVEALSEAVFGTRRGYTKINCGEFQYGHNIAKLIGSPPGYVGAGVRPLLAADAVFHHATEQFPLGIILFDEIEKAGPELERLMLGIFDRGDLTLGNNRQVDLRRAIIFMTSNLGARQIDALHRERVGFAPATRDADEDRDQAIYRTGRDAARRHFSPEFVNRIDKTIVFRALTRSDLYEILAVECDRLQAAVATRAGLAVRITYTQEARDLLVSEGHDPRYGARHLRRSLDRFVRRPLRRVISSGQVISGDTVVVDRVDDRIELRKKKA